MDSNAALTPTEVAERLKIAKNTVYELIKKGELRGYRVGNQVRVDESELEAYRRRGQPPGPLVGSVVADVPVRDQFVLSGQDPLLDLLARALEAHPLHIRVLRSAVGSYVGLTGLYLGTVQAASTHLWNADTQRYNVDFVRALVPGIPTVTWRLVTRTVGWYVRRGNPLGLTGWDALGRSDVVLANREKGSGIRVLLDGRLTQMGAAPPQGYDRELPSHLAVASAVGRGEADLGLGNEKSAAQAAGVEFVPLQTEELDLVVRRADSGTPAFQALAEVLRSETFRRDLEGLGGYGLDRLGQVAEEPERR